MGLPQVNITFNAEEQAAKRRNERGVVALMLHDGSKDKGLVVLTSDKQIPPTLSGENRAYIEHAFIGNATAPKRVLAYIMAVPPPETDLKDAYEEALEELAKHKFNYLVAPPQAENKELAQVAAWVKKQRTQFKATYKAVLPNYPGDEPYIINVTASGIKEGEEEITTAEHCSRVAGILAGTPLTESATHVPLPEITDIDRLTISDANAAIDKGEFICIHDGYKVKTARAVTSLKTLKKGQNEQLKKIKVVATLDAILDDLSVLIEDRYIGKKGNSYDNKCVLMTEILTYLRSLEKEGLLQEGASRVEIDIEAQRKYLEEKKTDISEWDDQQIKEAETGSKVFLRATIRVLDAIEDIDLPIAY